MYEEGSPSASIADVAACRYGGTENVGRRRSVGPEAVREDLAAYWLDLYWHRVGVDDACTASVTETVIHHRDENRMLITAFPVCSRVTGAIVRYCPVRWGLQAEDRGDRFNDFLQNPPIVR